MKLDQLQALTDQKETGIMAAMSLGRVRTEQSRNVRGFGQYNRRSAPNRADLRAAQFNKGGNSPYGHIYSGTVDPAVVAKRRAKNKVARAARAAARKRG